MTCTARTIIAPAASAAASRRLGLLRSDRRAASISPPTERADLFAATIGGLGLTGIITIGRARSWRRSAAPIWTSNASPSGTSAILRSAAESVDSHEHTVAWIDCLASGRAGPRHLPARATGSRIGDLEAASDDRALSVPFEAPAGCSILSRSRAFNGLYYRACRRPEGPRRACTTRRSSIRSKASHWNRLYGSRRLLSVPVPGTAIAREAAMEELLARNRAHQHGLVACGAEDAWAPRPRPACSRSRGKAQRSRSTSPNRGAATRALLGGLDDIVRQAGGRLYPAKDGRMPAECSARAIRNGPSFAAHVDPRFMLELLAEGRG